jgi:hypothetical protein
MLASARARLSPTLIAVLAVLVTAGGVAAASIPGAGGLISGCVAKATGALRVVDAAKHGSAGRCGRGERSLAWSQRGVQGLQGSGGNAGVQGVQGIQGSQGIQGFSQGSQGAPGPLTTVAPSGSTQRGTFNVEGYQVISGFLGSSISFALELAAAPTQALEVPSGESNPYPKQCPGTAQEPSAAAGYVCLYDRFSGNVLQTTGTNLQIHDIEGVGSSSNRFGLSMSARAKATGYVFVEGSWAVTAP